MDGSLVGLHTLAIPVVLATLAQCSDGSPRAWKQVGDQGSSAIDEKKNLNPIGHAERTVLVLWLTNSWNIPIVEDVIPTFILLSDVHQPAIFTLDL